VLVLNYRPLMNIEHKSALANYYAELQAGIYKDITEQRYVLIHSINNVQFIPMERITEEKLRKIYILEIKGDLTDFLAADAAPYVHPTEAELRQQSIRDQINYEVMFGKSNFQHIADDHPGGSSARRRLLGLDQEY
jgi:hypothetical protein